MTESGKDSGKLTTRQKRAIAALLSSKDQRSAAAAAGVAERTLYRYLQNQDFRQALRKAETRVLEGSGRRLLSGQDAALDALESLIGGAIKDSDRRLSAVAWLDLVLRWRDLDIENRLGQLEDIVYGKQNSDRSTY